MLDSCIEQLSPLAAQIECIENAEKATERVTMLTKRLMETPLPEPPLVEPKMVESFSGFCETPVEEHGTHHCLGSWKMQCTWLQAPWPPTRRALIVWTVYELAIWEGAWHPPTLSWVPLSFVLSLLVAEKNRLSSVYSLARVHGDPDSFVPVRLGTLD